MNISLLISSIIALIIGLILIILRYDSGLGLVVTSVIILFVSIISNFIDKKCKQY
ncbi:hypothetical protein J5U22_01851 [Saccharolobus shibatae]|uniref:Uncharacterized protein n=1 Tax=Saccharolobus shibatae TaxID=2286 RepID=A0A8F5C1B1_9CREN|nr:hypothetical protein J5U22_01851 [Saccharolobus shibatae]